MNVPAGFADVPGKRVTHWDLERDIGAAMGTELDHRKNYLGCVKQFSTLALSLVLKLRKASGIPSDSVQ